MSYSFTVHLLTFKRICTLYNYKVCRVNMLHKFFIIVIDYSFLSKKVAVHFPKRLPYIFQKGCRAFSKKVAVHFPPQSNPSIACLFTQLRCFEK